MTMHFDAPEYALRKSHAIAAIASEGLDALLMFAPESQYWICGYDTFGFALFQCLVLTAKGDLHLLTRNPDLRQARLTSTLSDTEIHIWDDIEGMNPAADLTRLLSDLGVSGRIGYEGQTAGLTDYNGQQLRALIPNLIESTEIIRAQRRIKSDAEVGMH
ncbi:MAG: Xaa-Pro dipeptidase, partial [Yoonia sp.]